MASKIRPKQLHQIPLTTGVTGVLPEANGGTDQSTYTTGDLLYASAANTLSKLPIGTAGQHLIVSGGIPTWSTTTAALSQKAGVVAGGSFAGNPKKATVTFATPFADANYSIAIIGATAARTWSVESVVAGSFVINANANLVFAGNVYWTATKHGEN